MLERKFDILYDEFYDEENDGLATYYIFSYSQSSLQVRKSKKIVIKWFHC